MIKIVLLYQFSHETLGIKQHMAWRQILENWKCLQSFQHVRTSKNHSSWDDKLCYQSPSLQIQENEKISSIQIFHHLLYAVNLGIHAIQEIAWIPKQEKSQGKNELPGRTFSGELGWKNLVWWFFCATITTNLGDHFSSRNLHACREGKIFAPDYFL